MVGPVMSCWTWRRNIDNACLKANQLPLPLYHVECSCFCRCAFAGVDLPIWCVHCDSLLRNRALMQSDYTPNRASKRDRLESVTIGVRNQCTVMVTIESGELME